MRHQPTNVITEIATVERIGVGRGKHMRRVMAADGALYVTDGEKRDAHIAKHLRLEEPVTDLNARVEGTPVVLERVPEFAVILVRQPLLFSVARSLKNSQLICDERYAMLCYFGDSTLALA